MLVLDVHRRVQSSIYGGKAVVIYDGAAAVAPAPDGGAALGAGARRRAEPVIPANATAPWASAIPRVIFQTFRSRSVPFRLHEAVMSWSRANPAYEHRIFDDDDMGAFVVETFGWDSREIRALNAAPSGARLRAQRADLFRYLVIHAHGGVYADADSVCVRPSTPGSTPTRTGWSSRSTGRRAST
ncbi:glycosyltransferase [Aureococcus anophagefferens]|nr:glycosyltransferase [Aureococcus anophagefferens]